MFVLMFAVLFLQVIARYSKKKSKEGAAATAFCCVGNGEEAPLRQAGEEKRVASKEEDKRKF